MIPKLIRNNHRVILKFIQNNSQYLNGKMLDLSAGEKPYKYLFTKDNYESCDIHGNHTYICDSEKIPVKKNKYDSILCTQVFEHIPRPWKTIVECNRILKKGGTLLLTVPQAEEIHQEPNNYFQYTKYGLKKLLEENGFEIIKIEPQSKWYSFIAEQFRMANRKNPIFFIFLWPLSEIVFPLIGIIFDVFETSGLQTEGWNVLAKKTSDLK